MVFVLILVVLPKIYIIKKQSSKNSELAKIISPLPVKDTLAKELKIKAGKPIFKAKEFNIWDHWLSKFLNLPIIALAKIIKNRGRMTKNISNIII